MGSKLEQREYLTHISGQLVNELTPITNIKAVTSNSDLLGKYTEAAMRGLIRRVVEPMRICTGAVIDHPMPDHLRQVDVIVWAPHPVPAVFETEGFGLVPRSSAFGVIEIKRSNYTKSVDQVREFLAACQTGDIPTAQPRGAHEDYSIRPWLAVFCLLESKPTDALRALLADGSAVAIFERDGEATRVRHADVLNLVNFLYRIAWRYRMQSALPGYIQVDTELMAS